MAGPARVFSLAEDASGLARYSFSLWRAEGKERGIPVFCTVDHTVKMFLSGPPVSTRSEGKVNTQTLMPGIVKIALLFPYRVPPWARCTHTILCSLLSLPLICNIITP